jgi:hypothetical protein
MRPTEAITFKFSKIRRYSMGFGWEAPWGNERRLPEPKLRPAIRFPRECYREIQ